MKSLSYYLTCLSTLFQVAVYQERESNLKGCFLVSKQLPTVLPQTPMLSKQE